MEKNKKMKMKKCGFFAILIVAFVVFILFIVGDSSRMNKPNYNVSWEWIPFGQKIQITETVLFHTSLSLDILGMFPNIPVYASNENIAYMDREPAPWFGVKILKKNELEKRVRSGTNFGYIRIIPGIVESDYVMLLVQVIEAKYGHRHVFNPPVEIWMHRKDDGRWELDRSINTI